MIRIGVLLFCFGLGITGRVSAGVVNYDAGGRRDPFIPLEGGDEVKGPTVSTFALEGIVYDPPQNSVALIGGQPCKVGDVVGNGKVLEIHKKNVVIEINSERTTLWLREDDKPQVSGGGANAS